MNRVLQSLHLHAQQQPDNCAIESQGACISYQELLDAVSRVADILRQERVEVLAIAMDNGPAWAIWDLAALQAGVTVVPISGFFSRTQRDHVLIDAKVQALVYEGGQDIDIAGCQVGWQRQPGDGRRSLPEGTAKITYTSGTTGTPKGVCLSASGMEQVAASLVSRVDAGPDDRHLSVLPLSVLLENIAGLYAPLIAGARCIIEPLAHIGLDGSSRVDPLRLLDAFIRSQATTSVVVPAMLDALTWAIVPDAPPNTRLRFLAIGGARVSARSIEHARKAGIPAFQGYGLSECASVVSLNVPGDDDPECAGSILPHTDVKISHDGEILVKNTGFLGYLGDEAAAPLWWPSGDLGHLDTQHHLHILGRRRHVFITAFGRNVSPEWVESELSSESGIEQVVLFGEARPCNVAVIFSAASDQQIEAGVTRANTRLPDYARIGHWVRATQAFRPDNGLATSNGRPRRGAIFAQYRHAIDEIWKQPIADQTIGG